GNAIAFRSYRQSLFPTAKHEEDRMELHEGMAEYTGVRLRGTTIAQTEKYMADRLADAGTNRKTYPMSFAYETGPAYGLLLDLVGAGWRQGLTLDSSLAGL